MHESSGQLNCCTPLFLAPSALRPATLAVWLLLSLSLLRRRWRSERAGLRRRGRRRGTTTRPCRRLRRLPVVAVVGCGCCGRLAVRRASRCLSGRAGLQPQPHLSRPLQAHRRLPPRRRRPPTRLQRLLQLRLLASVPSPLPLPAPLRRVTTTITRNDLYNYDYSLSLPAPFRRLE